MYIAVTTLAACALFPPILPAIADPIKFLLMFTSTNAVTVVFNTSVMILEGTMASLTTYFPRPSILQSNLFTS